jgi:hypothetical protein
VRLDAGIGIASTTADLGDVIESGARVKVAREPDRRAAADAIAATVRSPAAPPSLLSTAIVALWVQAIWMTSADSISSRGLAPSMNGKSSFL